MKTIFWIELVEGRDNPTEGPYVGTKFEREFGSNISALVVIITEPL